MNAGFFDRLHTRLETFFSNIEADVARMATLPERMERNLKILIAVIIGSFIVIFFLNRAKKG